MVPLLQILTAPSVTSSWHRAKGGDTFSFSANELLINESMPAVDWKRFCVTVCPWCVKKGRHWTKDDDQEDITLPGKASLMTSLITDQITRARTRQRHRQTLRERETQTDIKRESERKRERVRPQKITCFLSSPCSRATPLQHPINGEHAGWHIT